MEKKRRIRAFNLIIADGIPASEVALLRKDWDSSKNIVKNYKVDIRKITLYPGQRLLVEAIDVPSSEVKALKKHIKEALRDPSYTVITNYGVSVTSILKR